MKLNEFFTYDQDGPKEDGTYEPENDISILDKDDTRKTRLTLKDINSLRLASEEHDDQQKEEAVFFQKWFGQKAKIDKYPVLPSYFNEYNKIIYDRIINFKGMEKEVVILVDIDESMDIGQDIYVGVSRAKAQLIIISGKTALNRIRDLAF